MGRLSWNIGSSWHRFSAATCDLARAYITRMVSATITAQRTWNFGSAVYVTVNERQTLRARTAGPRMLTRWNMREAVSPQPLDPPEPRVATADVKRLLERHITPQDEDGGESVQLIAEKAHTSTRTVYRVLSAASPTLSLDLADRLLTAVHEHLNDCEIIEHDRH
jgi:hypothetical protein